MQATQQRQMLHGIIYGWDRRLRLQQTVAWLPRAVGVGLLIGIIVALVARTRPWLTNSQVGLVALALIVLAIVQLVLIVWLRPRSSIQSAQKFDYQFDLKERVSTALELLEGRIHTVDQLASYQLEDAYQQAQAVDANEKLLLITRWGEWLITLGLLVLLLVLLILHNPQVDALSQQSSQQQAIAEAAKDVQQIIEDVALDPNLTQESRENLLQSLQANLETLQEDGVSQEEALATLDDVESLLSEEANAINENLQAQQEALEDVEAALDRPQQEPPATTSEQAQQTGNEFSEMAQSLENMSAEETQTLADQLEAAADAMQETNPEMADALRRAAEAMREGDMEAAQEALEQAAQAAEEQAQAAQQQEQAAEQLQSAAEQAQESQENLEAQAAEGGMEMEPQEGPGQQLSGESGQEGQSDQGDKPSSMEGESQDSNPESMSSQPGEENSQAGNMQARPNEDTTGANETQQDQTGPDDDGSENVYEEVFAPRAINPQVGDEEIVLDPSNSDTPMQEGDFTENEVGESTVPYNEVFSDYANAANEALDQDYIPLGMRDVIRDYFTSLSPK